MATYGEKMETATDFIFLGSKLTADGDCSHEIKRRLLLGRKAMTNLDSIIKSRDVTLLTKGHIVKAIVFAVVMHRCAVYGVAESNMTEQLNNNCDHTTKPRLNVWNQCPPLMKHLEEESLTQSTYMSFK